MVQTDTSSFFRTLNFLRDREGWTRVQRVWRQEPRPTVIVCDCSLATELVHHLLLPLTPPAAAAEREKERDGARERERPPHTHVPIYKKKNNNNNKYQKKNSVCLSLAPPPQAAAALPMYRPHACAEYYGVACFI